MQDPENKTPTKNEAKNAIRFLQYLKRTNQDTILFLVEDDENLGKLGYYQGVILRFK